MGDPVFKTRDELVEWSRSKTRLAWGVKAQIRALKEIKRVTLAHAHLLQEPTK